MAIHPSSVVAPECKIGADVTVGPFCSVGPNVTLGDGVVLHSHVAIAGHTQLGAGCQIYPFASIGHGPQDLKYKGEPTQLIVGEGCFIREHVTMNPGTVGGGGVTKVGKNGLFMVGVHIAHDCQIGDQVIMANNATLGGHVEVGDQVIIGGLAAVHQFVRIGRNVMIGGLAGVEHDVVPYALVMGERASLQGLNLVGLKRRGYGKDEIKALSTAYDIIFGKDATLTERVQRLAGEENQPRTVSELLQFLQSRSARSLCRPPGT